MANSPDSIDKDWLKAKELVVSNISLLSNTAEVNEERDNILQSIKITVNNINGSVKTISALSPSLRNYIEALIPLLKMKHIDLKVNYYDRKLPLYNSFYF